MMIWEWVLILTGTAFVLMLFFIFRRPRDPFDHFRPESFGPMIVNHGNATGRPKGLRWVRCELMPNVIVLNDEMIAIVQYEIGFDIVPGSAMEGIEAATVPRPVTVTFQWLGNQWKIVPPVVFNLTPQQVREMRKTSPTNSGA